MTLGSSLDQSSGTDFGQALLGGLKLVADFGESFMEDVLTGVCDISGVSYPFIN